MIKSGKIAVVGDKDGILAFKAVGAEVFEAYNNFEANDVLRDLAKKDYAVIFITERLAALIPDTLNKLKARAYPTVIPIPSQGGSTGFAMAGLKRDAEKAIGADILFNNADT
ncbi:MAG: V-type ATP synthase subunit F [Clostridiales bacterium]|jgi:V/A-type H+-transporting ATPase subunit F|nr:V-type ATP synthase subunit F [Clostridiales bacterium]